MVEKRLFDFYTEGSLFLKNLIKRLINLNKRLPLCHIPKLLFKNDD
jgi:hypothetical protein